MPESAYEELEHKRGGHALQKAERKMLDVVEPPRSGGTQQMLLCLHPQPGKKTPSSTLSCHSLGLRV
jgi:hypothetical protein